MQRRGFLVWLMAGISWLFGACMSHYPQRNADTILDGTFGPTGPTASTGSTGATAASGPTGSTGAGGSLNTPNIFMGTSNEVFSLSSDFQITWASVHTDSNYTLNGDTVTINTTGLYWVSIMVLIRNTDTTPSDQEITFVTFGEDQGTGPQDNPFLTRDGGCDGEEGMLYLIEGIFSLTSGMDVGVEAAASFGGGAMTLDGGGGEHSFLMEFIR